MRSNSIFYLDHYKKITTKQDHYNLDHYKRQKQIYQLHLQNILCLTFSIVKLPTL